MTTPALRRTSRLGLLVTPLFGLVLFGALFAGVPTLSGWGFFVTPAFVLGLAPLLLSHLLVFLTPLRKATSRVQLVSLLAVVLLGFFAVFQVVPILDASTLGLAARQSLVATVAMVLEHGIIFLVVRGRGLAPVHPR